MTIKNRLQKLTNKLKPEATKIYYFWWANCTWTESEGINRKEGESRDDFCDRVHQITKKQFLWFD